MLYNGKRITDFNYTFDDVSEATRKTLDMCYFPPVSPGTRVTMKDGFIIQKDNWTEWFARRPFNNVKDLREYDLRSIEKMETAKFNPRKREGELSQRVSCYAEMGGRHGNNECRPAIATALRQFTIVTEIEIGGENDQSRANIENFKKRKNRANSLDSLM